MKNEFSRKRFPISSVFIATALIFLCVFGSAPSARANDDPLRASLCQVVFSLDQFPGEQGFHYIFFGNGFFVNDDGYLITAAHVLSSFRAGGQPYILTGPPDGPRRVFEASVIAVDWEHDVAVLQAKPNPFHADDKIAYLRLSPDTPSHGQSVVSASLRSPDVENAYSLDAPLRDFSPGEILDYRFHRDEGDQESELLLVSQHVVPGQSGSPLVSADSQGVIGVIVGQWQGPLVVHSAASGNKTLLSTGAALRIHYAINLLQQNHVAWYAAALAPQADAAEQQSAGFSPPVPLSVVGTPYPPQALFGGEVLLDASVDSSGELTNVRVVSGNPAFVDAALSAVQTWSFSPARLDGRPVDGQIGIVFQFPQSFLPNVTSKERKHDEALADTPDRVALPVLTVEPDYPVNSVAAGSVALYSVADAEGHLVSTSILRNVDSLTAPTESALDQWQFVPGKRAGAPSESAVVVVVTFRRPAI